MNYVDANLVVSGAAVEPGDDVRSSAVARLRAFMGAELDDPLPAMAEAAFYSASQVITPEQFAGVLQRIIGEDEAAQLLEGSPAERHELLQPWLPGEDGSRPGTGERF